MKQIINEYTKKTVLPKALRQLQELIWRALKLFLLPLGLFRLPFGGGPPICRRLGGFALRAQDLFSDIQTYFLTPTMIF